MLGTQTIVKNLAHQRGTTKDTAGHGHWNGTGVRKEASDDDPRQFRELRTGLSQDITRAAIAGICQGHTAGNSAAKSGEGVAFAARTNFSRDSSPHDFITLASRGASTS